MKKPLILITGPTATGKTQSSLALCKHLNLHGHPSEIINFDSLIFYQELNIGTAKPSKEELSLIPHHLINTHKLGDEVNASQYVEMAKNIVTKLHQDNITPILVGGSAFYIRALIKGMYDSQTTPQHVKDEILKMREEKGYQALRAKLKEVDPDSWGHIHENDDYRTTRALEHYLTHQAPLSSQRKLIEKNKPYDFSLTQDPHWSILNFYLEIPTKKHWTLIHKRTVQMIQDGLIEEVRGLLSSREAAPMQSIGYKETLAYLDGHLKSKEELIDSIYIATRQLAKSQKTFFKKVTPKVTLNPLEDIQDDFKRRSLSFLRDLSS